MPPKPWESSQRLQQSQSIVSSLSQTSQSVPKQIDEQGIGEISPEQAAIQSQTSSNPLNTNTSLGMGGYGSGMGSYGSGMGMGGYGGYGGMGGYGSSYGGYGGYGMGGMGMGMGMGMGRMGMFGNQNGQIQQTLEYLDSIGYLVNSLCEIARILEMNAQGLKSFAVSLYNLTLRICSGSKWLWQCLVHYVKKIYHKIRGFLLFENETDNEMQRNFKRLCSILAILVVLFGLTFLVSKHQVDFEKYYN